MKSPASAHFGCFTLFALPFCGFGLFAAFQALRLLQEGSSDTQQLLLLSIFALTFVGVGVGLMFWGRYSSRQAQETKLLREAHPNSPWMWQPDWASGKISGSNKATMLVAWGFGIFWNLVSAPLLFVLPEEIFEKGNQLAWLGLLFPLVGVGMVAWAVQATLRWKKFGSSVLEMASVPGLIGGRLRGTIYTGLKETPDSGTHLVLTCVLRRESRGNNSHSSEKILWQEEHTVRREYLAPGYAGMTVPVEFQIPFECQPTDKTDRYCKILWRLQASAEVAGVDFSTQFEVPVFKTSESSTEPAKGDGFSGFSSARKEALDPADATVQVRPSGLGGTEYYFGAARNKGAAASMTVFLLIFAGAVWLQLHLEILIVFPILTALVALLLLWGVIELWFTKKWIAIESGNLQIRSSTLGLTRTKEIPCSDIADVKLGISMQQQQTATQSGHAYYDIEIHRKHGKKLTAGRHIRSKREAEWLADQIKKQVAAYQ